MQIDIATGMLCGLLIIFIAWAVVLYLLYFVFKVDSTKDSCSKEKEAGAE